MSRTLIKTVKLLNNLLKPHSKVLVNMKNYRVILRLPQPLAFQTSRAYFSEEKSAFETKISVKNSISSDLPQDKEGKQLSDEGKPEYEPKVSLTKLISSEIPRDKENELLLEAESSEAREASWRTMKYTLILMGVSVLCFGTFLVLEFGKPTIGDDGNVLQDEYSNMPTLVQYLHRTLRELDYYKRLIKEPSREKLLPDELSFPYMQPAYTLVLELTDVLVHPDWTYQTGWRFKKRPGIDHFLETLSGTYEIVVYTAEQGMTVFPIIEALDPKNLIMYKLVRDATHFVDGHHVKNLDKLNRNLKKVVVVDWNPDSVKFHPENVFHIPRWNGNDDDTTLIDLTAFLMTMANSEVEDVRDVLTYYNQFDDGLVMFREKQRTLLEQQEAEKVVKTDNAFPTKNWPQNLLKTPSSVL